MILPWIKELTNKSHIQQISYIAAIMYLLSRIAVLCSTGSSRAHTAGKDMMLLFAVAALAFVVLTLIWALQCMMNFDRGLKPLLLGDREKKGQSHTSTPRTVSRGSRRATRRRGRLSRRTRRRRFICSRRGGFLSTRIYIYIYTYLPLTTMFQLNSTSRSVDMALRWENT